MAANQLDANIQKERERFLYSAMANIAGCHTVNPEIFLKTKISFRIKNMRNPQKYVDSWFIAYSNADPGGNRLLQALLIEYPCG
jgi:hypothetical protein